MFRFTIGITGVLAVLFLLSGFSRKAVPQPKEKNPPATSNPQGSKSSQTKSVADDKRKLDAKTQKEMTYKEMKAGKFIERKAKFNSEWRKSITRYLEISLRGPNSKKEWDRVYEELSKELKKIIESKPESDPERKSVEKRGLEFNQFLSARFMILSLRTQYSFSGLVVDEFGTTIPNVEVLVKIDYRSDFYPKDTPNEEVSFEFPDGKFNFRVKSEVSDVEISFKKKGYYTNRYQIYSLGKEEIKETEEEYHERTMKMSMRNDMPPIVFRKRHNIKVVLDKKGNVTNLNEFYGRLVRKSDGSGEVIDFSKSQPQMHKVKDIKNTKVLPENCIAFTAKPNKAVQFQDIYWDAKFKGVPTDNNHPVIEYRLIINDPDPTAGFYLVDPKKEGKYHKNRRMREAPENGYVRELVFGSKQKYQVGSFYIKINGKYGKGKIDDNGYYHSSNKASCGVLVRMQPDGSRNLEIPRWFIVSPYLNYEPRGK